MDPDIVNINAIKIVSKEDGKISLFDYGNSRSVRSLGTFSALRDALHLKCGFNEIVPKNAILTEGITDYYFFKMFIPIDNISIIPGAGCGQLKDLISILFACSDSFVVVLDNDSEGRAAYKSYERYFGQSFCERCYQYDGIRGDETDKCLESILSNNDERRIADAMECDNIKDAIVKLYFTEEGQRNEIISAIDSTTKNNISVIQHRIQGILRNMNTASSLGR